MAIKKSSSELKCDRIYFKYLASLKKATKKKDKQRKSKNKPKQKFIFEDELLQLIKKSYTEFLKSKYWNYVRKIVMKRDNYICTVCKTDKNLVVHHMTYKNHFNEHKHLDDLLTCCRDCHTEWHYWNEVK